MASSTYLKKRAQFQAILKSSKVPLARALAKMGDAKLTGSTAILEPAESKALFDSLEQQAEAMIQKEYEKVSGQE